MASRSRSGTGREPDEESYAQPRNKYQAIWATVRQIPKGKVATYSDVATLTGLPGQQRLVGYALHNLPPNSKIPWQRVVNSKGMISLPRRTGGYRRQRKLLEAEGIVFVKEVINLEHFGLLQTLEKG